MKKSALITLLIIVQFSAYSDSWIPKADLIGSPRSAPFSFSINGKGYMGAGMISYPVASYCADFWEYDPAGDYWTQKADFSGVPRYCMIGFSVGGYGYAGTGKEHPSSYLYNDMWKYDPLLNTWIQVSSFPGPGRTTAFTFTVNNEVYAGLGRAASNAFLNDWYKYNQATDTWIPQATFPGNGRGAGFAFGIGNKGYLGSGMIVYAPQYTPSTDCWEFDPNTNSWTQIADMPGLGRYNTVGFALNGKGYAGIGSYFNGTGNVFMTDFYEYDPSSNTWTQKSNYPVQHVAAGGFVVNGRGFVGCGLTSSLVLSNSLYEYSPDGTSSIADADADPDLYFNLSPNPANDKTRVSLRASGFTFPCRLEIFSIHGEKVSQFFLNALSESIDVSGLADGVYLVKLSSENRNGTTRLVIRK